jgi:hypothetical protein
VKRRDVEVAAFLERPAGWWREQRPNLNPAAMAGMLAFSGMLLAGMGELRGDELARLETIAGGLERHRTIRPDAARAILAERLRVEVE